MVSDRLTVIGGLGTWGDDSCLDDLVAELSLALSEKPSGVEALDRLSTIWPGEVVRAIGAVVQRTSDSSRRTRAIRTLVAALTTSRPDTRLAALRTLALLEERSAVPYLEVLLDEVGGSALPSAELVLALCRCGSGRAEGALDRLTRSTRAVDQWFAAVAAARLPATVRSRVWDRVRAFGRGIARRSLGEMLSRCVDDLDRWGRDASVVTLAGREPWTRTGVTLKTGDRFRVAACGLLAAPGTVADDQPEGPRPSSDLDTFGPEGREVHPHALRRAAALIARVGRHEVAAPIDPGQVFVAQDDGELLVRVTSPYLDALDDSSVDSGLALPTDVMTPASASGLILVRAERLP
jgi:hypothetical protein